MKGEHWQLIAAILFASIVKWALTEKPVPENETPDARRKRTIRGLGGIAAGMMLGWYGHEPLIRRFDALAEADTYIVAILLTIMGEHFVRWVMALDHRLLSKIAGRFFGGNS